MKEIEDIIKRIEALEKRFGTELMNFKEACAYLGYSPKYLYKLCYTGKIPFHNPSGRMLFFFKHELHKWIVEGRSRKSEDGGRKE